MKHDRRKNALLRLEAQLTDRGGVKKLKDGSGFVSLTDMDRRRIKKEIETLKSRL
jgi:hypothetical protein